MGTNTNYTSYDFEKAQYANGERNELSSTSNVVRALDLVPVNRELDTYDREDVVEEHCYNI